MQTNEMLKRKKITEDELFMEIDGVKFITIPNKNLKYYDLSQIDWKGVKVSNIDFSETNANVNPRMVYKRNISYCNFEGRDMSKYSFRGVKTTKTNLRFTRAKLHEISQLINPFLVAGCFFNGKLIPELFILENNNTLSKTSKAKKIIRKR